MALADWFDSFCAELQVKNATSISARYKRITHRLNTDFWNTTSDTSHSLYVGSYGRNAAINGFSDLDILFELPNALYHQYNKHLGNGQSALLQAVRASMQRTYPSSDIGGDGQVVVVKFDDNMTFEVVPGFLNEDKISYTYPNSNDGGSWKPTNPRPEIDAIRIRNNACNGNLVPLCRMMRAWKNEWDVPIGGLLIDTLAYQFIEGYEHREKSYLYYDYICRDFFRYVADQDRTQAYWRAPGSGARVDRKGTFEYKATRCHNLAKEAIAYEQHRPDSQEWSAKHAWREIFGAAFPN